MHEIKIPDELKIQEFSALVDRFNFLLKNFLRFDIGNEKINQGEIILSKRQVREHKKHDKEKWRRLKEDRELFIGLLKAHYLKYPEEFNNFCTKNNIDFQKKEMGSKPIVRLKELHKIKPQEIGLSMFPTKKIQIKDCRFSPIGEQNE